MLELAFDTFARQWGTQLTAKVRIASEVTSQQVTMLSYADYVSSLPATTVMVLCTVEGASARAVIQFPPIAALGWVGLLVGGTVPVRQPDRAFTPIETALIRRLMNEAIEDLRYSLGTLLPAAVEVESIEHASQTIQAAAPADLMLIANFTVQVGDIVSPATLAIPADSVLPQLASAEPVAYTGTSSELLSAQLSRVSVEVAVRFEPAPVRPSAVLALAVGDVLSLPHPRHQPLTISVDGQPLAQAAVGANGSRRAVVVVTNQENS